MADRSCPDETCREVLAFYFGEAASTDCGLDAFRERTKSWFFRDARLDALIRERFAAAVARAAAGELGAWRTGPLGRLGLIVLLDQFPRNLNRDSARAFDHDAEALAIALEGLDAHDDEALTSGERLVFYLPLMHAEDLPLQQRCTALYEALAAYGSEPLRPELDNARKAADRHREIIERFGRFPHRNVALGRPSTPEEIAFLAGPGSSF